MEYSLPSTPVLQSLFDSAKYSDIKVSFHGHTFLLHRCIVCSSSKFFSLNDKHQLIQLTSTSIPVGPDMLKSLLKYLYGYPITITPSNCYSFLRLAMYFFIPSLNEQCQEFHNANKSNLNYLTYSLASAYKWKAKGSENLPVFRDHIRNYPFNGSELPIALDKGCLEYLIDKSSFNHNQILWLLRSISKSVVEMSLTPYDWHGLLRRLNFEVVDVDLLFLTFEPVIARPEFIDTFCNFSLHYLKKRLAGNQRINLQWFELVFNECSAIKNPLFPQFFSLLDYLGLESLLHLQFKDESLLEKVTPIIEKKKIEKQKQLEGEAKEEQFDCHRKSSLKQSIFEPMVKESHASEDELLDLNG
ncbi:hypothetical protein P9112_002702 [Eukaryota sp. TZLM1-RC]